MAWVRDEKPAANRVRNCMQQAEDGKIQLFMSWINVGEVHYMLTRKHNPKASEAFLMRLPSLPIRLMLPKEEAIVAAAKLKSSFRISYADAFAAALAFEENATIVTGDPEIRNMANATVKNPKVRRLKVEWIGPPSLT